MKWMKKYPVAKWHPGDTRIKRKFLFIPRCLQLFDDHSSVDLMHQWRWLENAYIKQLCKRNWVRFGKYWYIWENLHWSTRDEYEKNINNT